VYEAEDGKGALAEDRRPLMRVDGSAGWKVRADRGTGGTAATAGMMTGIERRAVDRNVNSGRCRGGNYSADAEKEVAGERRPRCSSGGPGWGGERGLTMNARGGRA